MKAELNDNTIIKECFEAISSIIDEVSIECDNEGMRLKCLDKSHITFIGLNLNNTLFDEYTCNTPEKINIDTIELMKILKRAKSNDKLLLNTDEGNLVITLEGDATRTFNIRLIDLEYETPEPPEINPPVTFTMPIQVLSDFINDMELFDEKVIFQVDQDYFKCLGEGNMGSSEVKYLHGEKVNESVKSTYSIPKIKEMLKAKKLSKDITIKLGEDLPLVLNMVFGIDEGNLTFLLAPRLETEDKMN